MFVYVENVKNPTVRFQVMSYDKETKVAKLKGEYGAEFSRELSKESMSKFGYKIVKSETPLPLNSQPKAPAAPAPAAAEDDDEAPPPVAKKGKKKAVVEDPEEE